MKLIPQTAFSLVSSNVPAGDNQGYMFDQYLTTQTSYADKIEVEIDFNNCDRVALFNIDAYSVDFELTDMRDSTGVVVQTKTVDLEMSDGEYQQWIVEPIYIYADAVLKITLNKAGSNAKCGVCAIGLSTEIGTVQYQPKIGFLDYSIKATNDFGQTYLKVGAWAKKPSLKTEISLEVFDAVYEDLVAARGSVVIFEGNENDSDFESLRILGFLEDWTMKIDNPTVAWVDFTIQGVI